MASKRRSRKIWDNFKTHFEEEHDTLRDIRGTSMMHTGFHQANYVAERVLGEVESIQQNVINILKKHEQNSTKSVSATEEPTTSTSSNSTHMSSFTQDEKVFAVTDPQNSYLIKIIKDLQDEIKTMKAGKNKPFNRNRNTSKYCWSHGACSRTNKECRRKEEGHKGEATFEN